MRSRGSHCFARRDMKLTSLRTKSALISRSLFSLRDSKSQSVSQSIFPLTWHDVIKITSSSGLHDLILLPFLFVSEASCSNASSLVVLRLIHSCNSFFLTKREASEATTWWSSSSWARSHSPRKFLKESESDADSRLSHLSHWGRHEETCPRHDQ